MSFSQTQVAALQAKLDARHVKQRTQAGRQLSYVEGWWAIAEANRIFGHDAWHREMVELSLVSEKPRKIGKPPYEKEGWGVTYLARVKVTVGDVVREGCGAGHGIDADLGAAHESAAKEAETDAMKRALMTFGNPFGLALYDKDQANVERDADKEATVAPDGNQPTKKDPLAPWKGPLTKTELMKKLRQLTSDIQLCEDESTLDGCLSGYQAVIEQLKIDKPEWWSGEAHDGFTPLQQRIEDRRALLTQDPARFLKAG